MPYYISDDTELTGCPSWAVVKEDGETMGCHSNKSDAIKQMVAISLSERVGIGGNWEDRNK